VRSPFGSGRLKLWIDVIGDPGQGFVPSASRWFYGSLLDPQGTHFRTP
jgi:hypothetical protein